MEIKVFDKLNDLETINSWLEFRNMRNLTVDELSDYGIIITDGEKKLAALWLFPMIGVNWCMMEFAVTNPDSSKSERNEALDLACGTLHKLAKDLGYKKIFCNTPVLTVVNRLKKYGYIQDMNTNINLWGVL